MERTLTPLESEAVVHHLAQCVECREIVFLASEAAEDVESDEKFVAAAAPSRVAAMPVYADALHPALAPTSPPRPRRPRWPVRLRWAASIAAVAVVVTGGLVLRSSRAGSGHNATALTVASNRPVSAIPETQQTTAATRFAAPFHGAFCSADAYKGCTARGDQGCACWKSLPIKQRRRS